MFSTLIFFLAILMGHSMGQETDEFLSKFLNTLKFGVRLASTFLNAPRQDDVVSLILDKFDGGGGDTSDEVRGGPERFVPLFVRLLGVDFSRVEDYAFDGMIFLAHLISLALTDSTSGKRKQRSSATDFSPFQYLIKRPEVRDLLTQLEDPNILEFVLNESDRKLRKYQPEEVDCIPLLVCKMVPFVRGMQKSLRFFIEREEEEWADGNGTCNRNREYCREKVLWEKSSREDKMFFFLPGLNEVIKHGDECDQRFPKCVY